jgi:16S rRNA processing protein RimM
MSTQATRLLCIGKIIGAHGIRGEVKIHSFTENPEMLAHYTPITDKAGKRQFKIKVRSIKESVLIASLEGVKDRNEAELLRQTELYIPRDILPEIEEENTFYIEDLKGLKVLTADAKEEYGIVKDIYNYGASDLIAIETKDKKEEIYAFSNEVFPEINLTLAYLLMNKPEVEFVQEQEQDESKE